MVTAESEVALRHDQLSCPLPDDANTVDEAATELTFGSQALVFIPRSRAMFLLNVFI